MKTIIKKIIAALTPTPHCQFEEFIISKNPQSSAEVEYWVRIYERYERKSGGFIV
jgi:hypothetical protein